MGCIYQSSTLSLSENEILSELNTNRRFLLSKANKNSDSNTLNNRKEKLKLYSTQNVRNFKTNSNFKKSSTLNTLIKSSNLDYQNFVPRLSLQKFNELFDDSNIEEYGMKTKNSKRYSFMEKNTNSSKKMNNIEASLNTTLEQTLENVKENDYYKMENNKNNKKKRKN